MADAAHQALLHQKLHQAIVISGESGAGKTESANLLLKQLVFLSKVYSVISNKKKLRKLLSFCFSIVSYYYSLPLLTTFRNLTSVS